MEILNTVSSLWSSIEPKWPVYAAGAGAAYGAARLLFSGAVCKEKADLTGKTIFITGATSGIGIPTATILAKMGKPRVYIAARDMRKGAEVIKQIIQESGNADIHLIECDLADLESIKKCGSEFAAQIDLLILNAGLTTVSRRTTKQGFEMMVGSNHLGHAYLTHLLLPKLSTGARIVVVGSEAHRWGKLEWDDMHSEKWFSSLPIYSRSKLCNLHFARALAKRMRTEDNRGIIVNCLHPGYIASPLAREGGVVVGYLNHLAGLIFGKTPVQGAQTTIYAAISSDLKDKSGLYLSDCAVKRVAKHVTEENDEKLWDWTLETLKITNFGK